MQNRNFVLVSEERADRTFTDYHCSHCHAAGTQATDSPAFQIPVVGNRYPRGSLPALEAATWVREVRPEMFPAFELALFEAFFGRTEDISDPGALERIAASVEIEPSALRQALSMGRYRSMVLQECLEATNRGIRAIPTILIPGQAPIVGAVPYADLQRAMESALTGKSGDHGGTLAQVPVLMQEVTPSSNERGRWDAGQVR